MYPCFLGMDYEKNNLLPFKEFQNYLIKQISVFDQGGMTGTWHYKQV